MSKILTSDQRLHLQNLMKENNIQDNTDNIKKIKHSALIKTDVNHLIYIKNKYKNLEKNSVEEFDNMCIKECSFLFNNYTDLYNKIKKDIIDLNILDFFKNT